MQSTITKRVVAQVKDAWTYRDNDKSGPDEDTARIRREMK
jgi:hypothetical protein